MPDGSRLRGLQAHWRRAFKFRFAGVFWYIPLDIVAQSRGECDGGLHGKFETPAPTKDKMKDVIDWEAPQDLKDFKSFLAFANSYRRFVPKHMELALLLI